MPVPRCRPQYVVRTQGGRPALAVRLLICVAICAEDQDHQSQTLWTETRCYGPNYRIRTSSPGLLPSGVRGRGISGRRGGIQPEMTQLPSHLQPDLVGRKREHSAAICLRPVFFSDLLTSDCPGRMRCSVCSTTMQVARAGLCYTLS